MGRHDNFFELGGHSLLAMSLVSKYKQLNSAISITDLFTYPTIESLASYIQFQKDDSLKGSVATPLRTEGAEPPLFLVHEVLERYSIARSLRLILPLAFPFMD